MTASAPSAEAASASASSVSAVIRSASAEPSLTCAKAKTSVSEADSLNTCAVMPLTARAAKAS